MRSLLIGLLFARRAAGPTDAAESVLLGDQFLDNERATQTLPRTAKWLYLGGPVAAERLWVTPGGGGELRMVANGSQDAMALAYFAAAGAPTTLASGELPTHQRDDARVFHHSLRRLSVANP